MLVEMGKDIRSPHYICPDNLEAEHDRISKKTMEKAKGAKIKGLKTVVELAF